MDQREGTELTEAQIREFLATEYPRLVNAMALVCGSFPAAEDAVLHRFHADHASLRRFLVDEGFLSREGGVYWRTGGPVDL